MKVFQVWPKRTLNRNGIVLTPTMSVTVELRNHAPAPWGRPEVREAYQRIYNIDINKVGGALPGNFDCIALDR